MITITYKMGTGPIYFCNPPRELKFSFANGNEAIKECLRIARENDWNFKILKVEGIKNHSSLLNGIEQCIYHEHKSELESIIWRDTAEINKMEASIEEKRKNIARHQALLNRLKTTPDSLPLIAIGGAKNEVPRIDIITLIKHDRTAMADLHQEMFELCGDDYSLTFFKVEQPTKTLALLQMVECEALNSWMEENKSKQVFYAMRE